MNQIQSVCISSLEAKAICCCSVVTSHFPPTCQLLSHDSFNLTHASSGTRDLKQPHRFKMLLMLDTLIRAALSALFHVHELRNTHDLPVSWLLTGERGSIASLPLRPHDQFCYLVSGTAAIHTLQKTERTLFCCTTWEPVM